MLVFFLQEYNYVLQLNAHVSPFLGAVEIYSQYITYVW